MPGFCRARKFINVLTAARHYVLSWARWINTLFLSKIDFSVVDKAVPDLANSLLPEEVVTKAFMCDFFLPLLIKLRKKNWYYPVGRNPNNDGTTSLPGQAGGSCNTHRDCGTRGDILRAWKAESGNNQIVWGFQKETEKSQSWGYRSW
jgi:hypothetical protein